MAIHIVIKRKGAQVTEFGIKHRELIPRRSLAFLIANIVYFLTMCFMIYIKRNSIVLFITPTLQGLENLIFSLFKI